MAITHLKSNIVADMTGTVTVYNSVGSTKTIAATDVVRPSDWNSAHAEARTIVGANTFSNTTASGTNIVYSGQNGISIGGSADTIIFKGPQTTLSALPIMPFGGLAGAPIGVSSSVSLGQNSLYIFPFQLEDYLTVDHFRMPVYLTNSSSAAASVQKGQTYLVGIYSRNATNATVLTRHYSTSYTAAASHNSNVSWMLSIITAIGNSTSYNTLSTSSAGVNLSASIHGQRELIMPVSSLLTPGEYWIAMAASTSSVGAGGAVLNINNHVYNFSTFNRMGVSTAASNSNFFQAVGMGTYSATTGALPNGISLTQINPHTNMPIIFAATGTV